MRLPWGQPGAHGDIRLGAHSIDGSPPSGPNITGHGIFPPADPWVDANNLQDVYTKKEIIDMLRNSKYKQPYSIFYSITKKSDYGPGYLLTENNDKTYKPTEELRKALIT